MFSLVQKIGENISKVTWYTILLQLKEKTLKLYQMSLIYQERRLLSRGHHRVIDKYREWYIIVDWCMSLLVWTLIDYERLVHFLWKTRTFCYRLVVLVSCHKQAVTRSDDSFLLAVCHFFMNWDNISFFSFDGKFPILKAWFKNKF